MFDHERHSWLCEFDRRGFDKCQRTEFFSFKSLLSYKILDYMLMTSEIHTCYSTKLSLRVLWGEINKLLTNKSVVCKFPRRLLDYSVVPW